MTKSNATNAALAIFATWMICGYHQTLINDSEVEHHFEAAVVCLELTQHNNGKLSCRASFGGCFDGCFTNW